MNKEELKRKINKVKDSYTDFYHQKTERGRIVEDITREALYLIDQLEEPEMNYATEKDYLNEINRLETENKELRDELEQPAPDVNNPFGLSEQTMKWAGQAMEERYKLGKAEGYVEAVKELFRK